MDYKIEDKPSFRGVGRTLRVSTAAGENLSKIPQFWQDTMKDGTTHELMKLTDTSGMLGDVFLGICSDYSSDLSEFSYTIAVPVSENAITTDLTSIDIPALTWAVFESTGALPDAIQNTWQSIMGGFFETSGYSHGPGPELEVYPEGNVHANDYRCEVWVPVVKN